MLALLGNIGQGDENLNQSCSQRISRRRMSSVADLGNITAGARPRKRALTGWPPWFFAMTLGCMSCSKASSGPTFTVRLDDARGLEKGRPVLVRGVRVGSVKELRLLPDAVEVEFSLDSVVRATSDSCASVGTLSLMGEAHLHVDLGTGTPASNGSMRACPTPAGLSETTARAITVLDDLTRASGSLQRYLGAVERGERGLVELKATSPTPVGSTSPKTPHQ